MKATFHDFIQQFPKYKKFDSDANAMMVYEFLSRDASIIQMIDTSEMGRPALAPCAKRLEEMVDASANPTISFDDDFTKQAVGTMVRVILEPFGYVPCKRNPLPKDAGAEKFVSASCYCYDAEKAPPTMRVFKGIEDIKLSV